MEQAARRTAAALRAPAAHDTPGCWKLRRSATAATKKKCAMRMAGEGVSPASMPTGPRTHAPPIVKYLRRPGPVATHGGGSAPSAAGALTRGTLRAGPPARRRPLRGRLPGC